MTNTTIRLDPEVIEELDKLGKTMDRPRSWIIKEAVAQYLEYNKAFEAAIRKGLEDVNAGRLVSHEDVKMEIMEMGIKID